MKTILLLNDKTGSAIAMLQNGAPRGVTACEFESTAGCNCDRWGHPRPDCVERNIQPNAGLRILSPAKQTT
jgi:hypothetical protein